MIDLHCHILPGIDDGPETIEEAVELVRMAAALGTTTMVATPHVSPRYPNDSVLIADGVAAVRAALVDAGVTLDVRPGAEIAIPQIADLLNGELPRLGLDGGDWLLIESPFKTPVETLPAALGALGRSGYRLVLAHPERCPGFHRRPDVLETLIRDGEMLGSVTAGSLVGQFGHDVEEFALWMARAGLIHNVASDAHDCIRRPPGIAEAMEQAGLGDHIQLLAHDFPNAILTGGPLPDTPPWLLPPRPARRGWRRSARQPD
ncbi:MAG TPA: CpsB/CapC family capsule biosynthesis tyrosine phosphatase [Solirubrobacteraceae bacterium]|nr:CpsB/CapC family capsule biosynthesis tyrosine phosphatase [Solirubrobacteraceae bacterium]